MLRALRPEYVLVSVRWTGPRQQTLVADTRVVGAGMWSLVATQTLAEDEFGRGQAQYLAPELKGFDARPHCAGGHLLGRRDPVRTVGG